MKVIAASAVLAALISMPISNAHATITTTENGTVTTIYGTGNPNTWEQVVTYSGTDGNFQLALNTHINPNNGHLNADFSINVDPAGLGGSTLATDPYSYLLYVNGNPSVTFNLATLPDNQYGTSATLNGKGKIASFALGSVGNTIFQNSEPESLLDLYFGITSPTSITLEVVGPTGAVLASDTIPPSAVPEPSTYLAGALLLLPFGVTAFRSFNKKRTA